MSTYKDKVQEDNAQKLKKGQTKDWRMERATLKSVVGSAAGKLSVWHYLVALSEDVDDGQKLQQCCHVQREDDKPLSVCVCFIWVIVESIQHNAERKLYFIWESVLFFLSFRKHVSDLWSEVSSGCPSSQSLFAVVFIDCNQTVTISMRLIMFSFCSYADQETWREILEGRWCRDGP